MLAQELDFSTDYSYDSASQLSSLKNYIATEKKGGKPPPNIEEISLLEKGYPDIRKSGTRLSGNQYIRDNVPDLRITQSPSPGSPDNQITFLEQSSFPKHIEYLASSIEHLLFSPKNAEAQSLPLLNSQFTYTYDNVGNRLSMAAPNGTHSYTYNNIYELTNVSGAQTHSFAYDNVGNRQTADGVNYSSNNLNQYTQVSTDPYRYDANGNLTNDGVYAYTYDYENRLTSAVGNGHNATYTYDAFGRRISKTVDGVTTKFIYDADRIIEERDGSNQLIASYIYGEGIDEILTMTKGAQTYYYFYDGLGSVTDITNANGEVIESYSYDVYGLPNHVSTIGNRYMFTGREFDTETGLYYNRARYYSPVIGRFLQKDPLTWTPSDMRASYRDDIVSDMTKNLLQSRGIFDTKLLHNYNYADSVGKPTSIDYNLYQYAHNNPVNFIDPYGEYPVWIVATAVVVLITYGVELIAYSFGKYHPSGLRGGATATTFMWNVEQIRKKFEANRGDKFGQDKNKCKK